MDDTKSGRFGCYRDAAARGFLFVILISAVVTTFQSQRVSGRSIIFEELTQRWQQQRNETSVLLPCLRMYMDEYFEVPGWVSIVLPDELQDTPDFTGPFMSELRKKITIYTVSVDMISVIKTYEGAADPIFLSKNASGLVGKDICLANHCKHDCDFMIVLTTPFADEASFLAEADELIRPLCLRSIFELVILALVGDSAVIVGSPSSRINGLYTIANATVLARCVQEDAGAIRWQRSVDERSSLDENAVNAAIFENFPFTMPIDTGPDGLRFDGIEGTMVEQIAHSLKIQLNREVIVDTNMTIEKEMQSRLFDTMSSDIVFGGFLWSYNPKVEYTNSYGMVHITWLVPIQMNISLNGLITPFSAVVWYAIICTLIIGALVKHFFIRDISFLDIAGLLFGMVINRQPVKTSSRIQFIAWTFFGFFLTQLYLGSMADQLMNASIDQIDSMDDLMNSGLMMGSTKQLANLLNTSDKGSNDDDAVRHAISKHIVIFEEHTYNKYIADIIEGKNDTLAMLVMLNLSDIHLSDIGSGHIMKETIGTFPLALATWRGFPYLRDINFKIQVLLQTGIVDHWSDMMALMTNYERGDVDQENYLDIMALAPAFLLLIIGFAGGCLLLIVEILFYPSPYLL
ncbi:uncharacterized protein LOC116853963 [Odontomachus brunneus]|uniref:uncharacterized protein LOC116853963 n=1 Tax=Odontomachus brunneus TaxID=486640 RepID=UPI0013F27BC6|nr:uncharacterized protein LOC116853963 [Odontomachus brunneus]